MSKEAKHAQVRGVWFLLCLYGHLENGFAVTERESWWGQSLRGAKGRKARCLEYDANAPNSLSHVGSHVSVRSLQDSLNCTFRRGTSSPCKLCFNKIHADGELLIIFARLFVCLFVCLCLTCTITVFQSTVNEITFSPYLFKKYRLLIFHYLLFLTSSDWGRGCLGFCLFLFFLISWFLYLYVL